MTMKRNLTSLAVAAAIAVTALGPMATAANADGWRDGRRGGPDYAYARQDRRNFNRNRRAGAPRHNRYAHRRYKRDNTGKYIALGVGAFMLGIIASQAHRY